MKFRLCTLIGFLCFITSLSMAATGASVGAINRAQLKSEAVTRVDTIAALRLVSGVKSGQLVQVGGYYANGDGGGGPGHRWDAASVCTDDGGSCIDPVAAGAGRWLLQYHENLNIAWFGLKGDGVTDNLVQLKKVIALALANNLEVIVPPGIFYSHVTEATGPIPLNIPGVDTALKIRGYDPKTCILKFGPDDPRSAVNNVSVKIFYSNRSTSTDPAINTTATFVKLQDVTFQGPDIAGPDMLANYNWVTAASPDYYQKREVDCFYLSGGDDGGVIAENVHFTGKWSNNIVSTAGLKNYNSFVRCRFNNYSGALLLFTSNNTVTVDDCDFDRSGTRRAVMLVDRGDSYGHGVYFRVDTTFVIKNSRFWDVASSAVNMSSGSALLTEMGFTGKTFYQILSGCYFAPTSERILYTGFYYPHMIVENNVFDGVNSYGITANTGIVVKNNIFGRNYDTAIHYASWAAKDERIYFEIYKNTFKGDYGVYTQTEVAAPPKIVFNIHDNIFNCMNVGIRINQWNEESRIDNNVFLASPIEGTDITNPNVVAWNAGVTSWEGLPNSPIEYMPDLLYGYITVTNCKFYGPWRQAILGSDYRGHYSFKLFGCEFVNAPTSSHSAATRPYIMQNCKGISHTNFSASIKDLISPAKGLSPVVLTYDSASNHGVGTTYDYDAYTVAGSAGPFTITNFYFGRVNATPTGTTMFYGEVKLHLTEAVTFAVTGNIRTVGGSAQTFAAGTTVIMSHANGVWTVR